MDDQLIKEQWIKFTQFQSIDPTIVRSEILASWQRSREYNVNPFDGVKQKGLSKYDLEKLLKDNAHLIEVAKPHMYTLHHSVRGSGFMVVLTNQEGRVLHYYGDSDILDKATNQFRNELGFSWSEQDVGGNAISIALTEGKPIQLSGAEHYCTLYHNWTCSSAPIRGHHGEIIGCIDISGPKELIHSHTLGMIIAGVEAIENQIRKETIQEQKNRTSELLETVTESISEGLLAVDNDLNIMLINSALCKIIKITRKEVLGKNLYEVLGRNEKLCKLILNRKWFIDEEITINTVASSINCISSACPIFRKNGLLEGVVLIIRETQKVHQLINRMVGATARFTREDIIGESEMMKRAIKSLFVAANSESNVLLLGESGTGKELFAQAIHCHSNRRASPFVAVNCAALPRELIQSELFGYAEGAFTGAKRGGNPGKFELANGGTIFLDEIGDMPMDLQVNLLRVLQEHKVTRVGGDRDIPLDVRIIAATNQDLLKEVNEGKFREDLFYRLHVLVIQIPPLRQRGQDIELLTNKLIDKFSSRLDKKITGLSPEFMQTIKQYSWPGNVRELQNALEHAINIAEAGYLTVNDLPINIRQERRPVNYGEVRPLAEVEREMVESALLQFKGNISRAAKALGVNRNTLYNKMRKYKLEV